MTKKEKSTELTKLTICGKCGLFGSCKDSAHCPQMEHSTKLGLGKRWHQVAAENEAKGTWDDISWSYYFGCFCYMAGQGLNLARVLIIVPIRFVAYDCLYSALSHAHELSKKGIYQKSIDTADKTIFVSKADQLVKLPADKDEDLK